MTTTASPDTAVEICTLDIGGMTCAACVRRIEKSLLKLDGVSDARVNLATEVASVTYSPELIRLEDLTGAVTKAILARGLKPEKLVAIEYSTDFYEHLVRRYRGVHFVNGDAFDLDRTLGALKDQQFDSVISCIPLLNFPVQARAALIDSLLDRIPHGRPVVQISYGPVSPVIARPDRYHIQHFDFIVRNIPPAQLWIYRRT